LKLVISIVRERDKQKVSDALLQAGHKFTVIASTGGFLRDGQTTLLIGTSEASVDGVIDIVTNCCSARDEFVVHPPTDVLSGGEIMMSPVKVTTGGAIVFVVDVERFVRV
jgi:uncharacterized protein YaaQ